MIVVIVINVIPDGLYLILEVITKYRLVLDILNPVKIDPNDLLFFGIIEHEVVEQKLDFIPVFIRLHPCNWITTALFGLNSLIRQILWL